jgi:hypothetical protein
MRKSLLLISAAMMAVAPALAFAQQTDGGPSKGTRGAAVSSEGLAPTETGRSSTSDQPMNSSEVNDSLKTNPHGPVSQTDGGIK